MRLLVTGLDLGKDLIDGAARCGAFSNHLESSRNLGFLLRTKFEVLGIIQAQGEVMRRLARSLAENAITSLRISRTVLMG